VPAVHACTGLGSSADHPLPTLTSGMTSSSAGASLRDATSGESDDEHPTLSLDMLITRTGREVIPLRVPLVVPPATCVRSLR
jgi:hypothetical protein